MKIAIVGAGPAGLFCAYELALSGSHEIYLFDKGHAIEERRCPDYNCVRCPYHENCAILCGEGGAGGYSDGKLTLSVGRGVQVGDEINFANYQSEMDYLDKVCVKFGPKSDYYSPIACPTFLKGSGFEFESYPLRFFGTKGIRILIANLHSEMAKLGVKFRYNINVLKAVKAEYNFILTYKLGNTTVTDPFDKIVLATGSYDNKFMRKVAALNGIVLEDEGPAGIGIRIEADDSLLEPLMSEFYDFKLYMERKFKGAKIQYRSFCVNRSGKITNEVRPEGLTSINGRSEFPSTGRSNLAIMTKIPQGKKLVRDIARHMNEIGKGLPLSQTAFAFVGRHINKVTENEILKKIRHNATPSNIAVHMPQELYKGFADYIRELNTILPGLIPNPSTIVYAPEIKYHMPRWPLKEGLEVNQYGAEGMYVIGNSTGFTDSISTAATMGIVTARHIIGD